MSCTELQRGSLSLPQYLSCSDLATLIGDISENTKVKIGCAQEPHCLHSHNSHASAMRLNDLIQVRALCGVVTARKVKMT